MGGVWELGEQARGGAGHRGREEVKERGVTLEGRTCELDTYFSG